MGTDDTRMVNDYLDVVSENLDDGLVNEVEVVTMNEGEPAPPEDVPQTSVHALGEGAVTSSVATSAPWDLFVREVKALRERLTDLMRSVHERLIEEESVGVAQAVAPEPVASVIIVDSPPVSSRSPQQASNQSSDSSNSAVKRKSSKSKYAKKRRTVVPGGVIRTPRSFNEKPSITTVGQLNLSAAAYDDDEDFD